MGEADKQTIEALLSAIRAEGDGYNFYSMTATSIKDKKGKEVFTMLAEEELKHKHFLEAQLKSIRDTGAPDKNVHLGQASDLSNDSPIFSPEIKNRLSDAHYEMSALSVGIQLELSSQKFYKQQAEAAKDETMRAFFSRLADWEAGHYRALLRQQDELKDDYWTAGGFAPF